MPNQCSLCRPRKDCAHWESKTTTNKQTKLPASTQGVFKLSFPGYHPAPSRSGFVRMGPVSLFFWKAPQAVLLCSQSRILHFRVSPNSTPGFRPQCRTNGLQKLCRNMAVSFLASCPTPDVYMQPFCLSCRAKKHIYRVLGGEREDEKGTDSFGNA